MTNLHFNYKDVFRAGRLGFSAKKWWVSFLGLLIAFVGYDILSYVAFVVGGIGIGEVWETFRLMPMYPSGLPWFSWLIWALGFLWWLCIALLAGVAISKITYEQLKGDEFYEIKEAIKFAMKSGKSSILAPLFLILFMAALIIMGLILALITWIPYLGQLIFMIMAIPVFAVCLFIIYLMIVTVVSLVIGPSIVGATGNDTFDTLFESFSVINDQPWRFIVYQVLLKCVMIVGVGLLGYFSAKAIFLGQAVIGLIVPAEKLGNILSNAAYYVRITVPTIMPEQWINFINNYIEMIGMPNLLYPPDYIASTYESWAGAISSFVLGIIYYLIVLFVSSLGCAIYWAGNTVIFTVLVKKKDDKNLLEIKEEVFEEKPAEEKVETEEEKKTKRTKKKESETPEPNKS